MTAPRTAGLASRHWLLVLGLWQLFVWGTRIRNVMGDRSLLGLDQVLLVSLSATFVTYGIVALWAWRQLGRTPGRRPGGTPWLVVGAAWTVLVWCVRGTGIVLGDHDVGFVVVHLVLAVVSVALAVLSLRVVLRLPAGSDAATVSPTTTSGS